VSVPEGDMLIHAGDFCGYGNMTEMSAFNGWMGTLPHKYKVVVAGNHDKICEKFLPNNRYDYIVSRTRIAELTSNFVYLMDSFVVIEGLKIYGSPWQPEYYDWAFNLPRGGWQLKQKWDMIPEDTDILVTHSPELGVLDYTRRKDRAGCELLSNRIKQLKLKLHIFGHIHESYGIHRNSDSGLVSVNASICTLEYQATNKPLVVDL
jgi:calcineurin-like phosphoesterase family protein